LVVGVVLLSFVISRITESTGMRSCGPRSISRLKLTSLPLHACSGRSLIYKYTASAGPATSSTAMTKTEIRLLIIVFLLEPKCVSDSFIVAPHNYAHDGLLMPKRDTISPIQYSKAQWN